MGDALKLLTLDIPYRTGPIAWTDLHAGGLFFCVVYRECLQFHASGQVRRWCEILDDSRPFDNEADQLRATDVVGSYSANDRGYLSCLFPSLELTGLPCAQTPDLLAFHVYCPASSTSYSLVYSRVPASG